MAMIKRLVLKGTQQDGIIRELEQEAAYLRNPAVVCVCNKKAVGRGRSPEGPFFEGMTVVYLQKSP